MLFNSYIFILFFLPVCLAGYYIFNYFKLYKVGIAFLLGMSLWFYGYFNPKYLLIICGSVIVNYTVYLILNRMETKHNAENNEEGKNLLKKWFAGSGSV